MDNTIYWLEPIAPLISPVQAVTVGPEELLLHTPLRARLLALKNDIDSVTPDGYWDDAKKITKLIKESKIKVQASIQGDAVRVTGAKRDDLQEAMALLRKDMTELPLSFDNFRD